MRIWDAERSVGNGSGLCESVGFFTHHPQSKVYLLRSGKKFIPFITSFHVIAKTIERAMWSVKRKRAWTSAYYVINNLKARLVEWFCISKQRKSFGKRSGKMLRAKKKKWIIGNASLVTISYLIRICRLWYIYSLWYALSFACSVFFKEMLRKQLNSSSAARNSVHHNGIR